MEGLCEGCGVREWRYKCPGCERKSCSVACVKRHKTELGCQGKRCKTKFVSIPNFTTGQLLSDYHFLEEAGRVIESADRGWLALSRRQRDVWERRQTLQRVQSVARKRGTSLHLLPQGMARHRLNTSRTAWNMDRKQWGVEWRVRLVFPQAALEYSEERVCEDWLIADVLKRYIHPSESDPVIRHRLRCYVGEEVIVFLKLEKTGHCSTRYCRLQLQSSLADNLRKRTIVEFPELHIVLPTSVTEYTQVLGGEGREGAIGTKGLVAKGETGGANTGIPCAVIQGGENTADTTAGPAVQSKTGCEVSLSSLGRLAESYRSDGEEEDAKRLSLHTEAS